MDLCFRQTKVGLSFMLPDRLSVVAGDKLANNVRIQAFYKTGVVAPPCFLIKHLKCRGVVLRPSQVRAFITGYESYIGVADVVRACYQPNVSAGEPQPASLAIPALIALLFQLRCQLECWQTLGVFKGAEIMPRQHDGFLELFAD